MYGSTWPCLGERRMMQERITTRIYLQPLGLIRLQGKILESSISQATNAWPHQKSLCAYPFRKSHMATKKLPPQKESSQQLIFKPLFIAMFVFFGGSTNDTTLHQETNKSRRFDFLRWSTWSNRAGGLWLSKRNLNGPLSPENLDAHWSGLSHTHTHIVVWTKRFSEEMAR